MQNSYEVPNYIYVAYDIRDIKGVISVFSSEDQYTRILNQLQAQEGYYLKWEMRGEVAFASRFDGTLIYQVDRFVMNRPKIKDVNFDAQPEDTK